MTEADQRFTLTAPPPVRALAIAAVTALVGAALMVLARILDLGSVVLAVGVVGLGLAIALALAALVLAARAHWTLALAGDAITVTRAGRTRRVPWGEIETVTLSGPRLTLVRKSGGNIAVLNPRTPHDPTFAALLSAVQQRLDVDRGYKAY